MVEFKLIKENEWLPYVEQGANLITVNRRLTRYLHEQYDRKQALTQTSWHTPNILPISAWCRSVWENSFEENSEIVFSGPLLLTSFQASLVWQRVIQAHQGSYLSRSDEELTHLAMKAWGIINEWCIPEKFFVDTDNANVTAFCQWMTGYKARCCQGNWIDEAVLPSKVLDILSSNDGWAEKQSYIFAGFDEFSPRQLQLIDALQKRNNNVYVLAFSDRQGDVDKRIYQSIEDELVAAAEWAAELVTKNSSANIGIIVPGLANLRGQVKERFESVLHVSTRLNYGRSKQIFNISLGRSLSQYPMIRSVFSALSLTKGTFTVDEYSAYLLNHYFTQTHDELNIKSLFDVYLREYDELWLDAAFVQKVLSNFLKTIQEHWSPEHIAALLGFQEYLESELYPSQWCFHVAKLLQQLNWLRGLELTSEEYQLYNAWQQVMDEFSQLDGVSGKLNWETAYGLLYKMVAGVVFQAEADVVPIHIMGLFETAGLSFDAVWVLGLNDDVLPASPAPNPFIPIACHKKYALPHSSCEREYKYAVEMIERICSSARNVVLSCAALRGECELRPSSVLGEYPELNICEPNHRNFTGAMEIVYQPGMMASWQDYSSPLSEESLQIRGGAAVYKHQAACPFRAFGYFRLTVQKINQPAMGLNHLQRGILMHGVLERFWKQVKSHAGLINLDEESFDSLLIRLAEAEIKHMADRMPMTFTPRFTRMECNRLARRAKQWLKLECERQAFKVMAVESQQSITVEGLTTITKMDRIDELSDGSLMLIDYKTGEPQVKSWFGERPDEPQLPLYASALGENIKAVAFGQLKVGKMEFKGLADSQCVPDGIEQFLASKYAFGDAQWDNLLEEWRGRLKQLALEFRSGVADVKPKEGSKSCQQCDLNGFCRVSTLALSEESAGE